MTTKSLAAPDAELQAIFGALPSGLSVGAAQALTVPAVASAIRLISEAAACLGLRIERRVGGVWTEAAEHPVAALLADRPNDWTDGFSLVRDMVAAALVTDKGALALANKVDGRVIELVRYEAGHFTVDYSGDGRMTVTTEIVSLDALKEHVRIDHDDEDAGLTAMLEAARRHVEAWVGPLDDFEVVPADIVEAMKQLAAHMYENREVTVTGTIISEIKVGFYDLIGPHRKWEF